MAMGITAFWYVSDGSFMIFRLIVYVYSVRRPEDEENNENQQRGKTWKVQFQYIGDFHWQKSQTNSELFPSTEVQSSCAHCLHTLTLDHYLSRLATDLKCFITHHAFQILLSSVLLNHALHAILYAYIYIYRNIKKCKEIDKKILKIYRWFRARLPHLHC